MSKIILYQVDGKIPNLALTRIAAHHRDAGDDVELRVTGWPKSSLYDDANAKVYASAIFTKSAEAVQRIRDAHPNVVVGGTGADIKRTLADVGITTSKSDYSLWSTYPHSIGFSQRGCRLTCKFCVVPEKEGKVVTSDTIASIWRGSPWPRNIVLLDNDFFGQKDWRGVAREIVDGEYKVCLMQGINIRFINDESAETLAALPLYDDQFKHKRIYTAWDNRGDEERVVRGLETLFKYGAKPRWMMVYMLIGYWPNETEEDWVYRESRIRSLGCMAYPMPYVRNKATVGFQRFVITRYSRHVPWADFKAAGYKSPYKVKA